jgi:ABC-type nitrate/sulfonate/bicarbonate transport system substrate-binding protein
MITLRAILGFLLIVLAAPVSAQKLMLAHVAVNPSQGMLHLAKDSGILAKYGFTAEVLLIPGTPRTIQALIAGDLDYVAAGAPASLRARAKAPTSRYSRHWPIHRRSASSFGRILS